MAESTRSRRASARDADCPRRPPRRSRLPSHSARRVVAVTARAQTSVKTRPPRDVGALPHGGARLRCDGVAPSPQESVVTANGLARRRRPGGYPGGGSPPLERARRLAGLGRPPRRRARRLPGRGVTPTKIGLEARSSLVTPTSCASGGSSPGGPPAAVGLARPGRATPPPRSGPSGPSTPGGEGAPGGPREARSSRAERRGPGARGRGEG
jgi:hypothetical protein